MPKSRPLPNRKDTRKEVYALLGNILGRGLTIPEHNEVKEVIEKYIKGVLNGLDVNEKPRTHHLLCTECTAKRTIVGTKEIKNVYKGKRRGFVAQ